MPPRTFVSLDHLRVSPHPKDPDLAPLLWDSVRAMHARLGLPVPALGSELLDRPWVFAGEQLGVELRPATLYKLLILSLLGERGYVPVFLIEERDVASKASRLRSWTFPRATPDSIEGFTRNVSPLARSVTKKSVEDVPLAHVPAPVELQRAQQLLVGAYADVVGRAELRRVEALAEELLDGVAGFARGASLAQLGQRQLVEAARRMGFGNVLFCDEGALEEALLASPLGSFLGGDALSGLSAAGLLPADCEPFWGQHLGGCTGRVRVPRDGAARCLRCKAALSRSEWAPYSLRAAPRMLSLVHLGMDLFVTGGTSAYNDDVRRVQHARGARYPPLLWRYGMTYAGPHQRASVEVARQTGEGAYSLLDAVISAGLETSGPASLARAFERLGADMRAAVCSEGVSVDGLRLEDTPASFDVAVKRAV